MQQQFARFASASSRRVRASACVCVAFPGSGKSGSGSCSCRCCCWRCLACGSDCCCGLVAFVLPTSPFSDPSHTLCRRSRRRRRHHSQEEPDYARANHLLPQPASLRATAPMPPPLEVCCSHSRRRVSIARANRARLSAAGGAALPTCAPSRPTEPGARGWFACAMDHSLHPRPPDWLVARRAAGRGCRGSRDNPELARPTTRVQPKGATARRS